MRAVLACSGLAAVLAALPVAAQEQPKLRPLCASRPGISPPPCILDKGHFQAEFGILDFEKDSRNGIGVEAVSVASTEVSYGLDGINQLSIVWDPINIITLTDESSGRSRRVTGVGDVALRWRHSLRNPAGNGLSVAVGAFLNIPTGPDDISRRGWGLGVTLPLSYAITNTLAFITAPGLIFSENTQSDGRHFEFNGSFGLSKTLGEFNLNLEAGYSRDGEPDSGRSSATVSTALAWQPRNNPNLQLDVGISVAANRDAPDLQAYFGIVRRF